MAAEYIYKGETIDYTNPSDENAIGAGDVIVLGTKARIAIAACDIPPSGVGAVHVIGVFKLPKGTGAITQGTAVYWDGEKITTTSSSNTPAGYAAAPAASGDTEIEVKLVG